MPSRTINFYRNRYFYVLLNRHTSHSIAGLKLAPLNKQELIDLMRSHRLVDPKRKLIVIATNDLRGFLNDSIQLVIGMLETAKFFLDLYSVGSRRLCHGTQPAGKGKRRVLGLYRLCHIGSKACTKQTNDHNSNNMCAESIHLVAENREKAGVGQMLSITI